MQTPDFWSIPFVGGPPVAADAPALLGVVLRRVVTGRNAAVDPLRYDDDLGAWWSSHGVRGALEPAPRSGAPRSRSACSTTLDPTIATSSP